MKLYIKNEFIHDKPGFIIYDDNEKKKYSVSVNHSVLGMKLDVFNLYFNRVAKIRQRGHSFNKSYSIVANKKSIKLILKVKENNISTFIKGINWEINGDIPKKDFCVLNDSKFVVMEHKCDEININISEVELLCLCIALCIDTLLFFDEKESEKNRFFLIKNVLQSKKILDGLSETKSINEFCDLNDKLKSNIIKDD